MTTRADLLNIASDGRRGIKITANLFGALYTVLRRRFTNLSFADFEILTADLYSDVERALVNELRGRVHVDDIKDDMP